MGTLVTAILVTLVKTVILYVRMGLALTMLHAVCVVKRNVEALDCHLDVIVQEMEFMEFFAVIVSGYLNYKKFFYQRSECFLALNYDMRVCLSLKHSPLETISHTKWPMVSHSA